MDRREAAWRAPIGTELHRPDSRVVVRDDWVEVVTPSAPGNLLNEIYVSKVADEDAERVIDEVLADHAARKKRVKWCVGHWTKPADFGARLARRGFTATPVRAMGCDASLAIAVPDGVSFVEIDRSNLDAYLAVETRGWGIAPDQIPIERESHLTALEGSPRTAHFFAAIWEAQMVGTAGVFLRDGYGYLVGSQILEHARGKGIYRALVAARLELLRATGRAFAVTHARDATSAPMLEHLGFETLFPYDVYYSPELSP